MAIFLSRRVVIGCEKWNLRHVMADIHWQAAPCMKFQYNFQTWSNMRMFRRDFIVEVTGCGGQRRWQSSVPVDHTLISHKIVNDPYQLIHHDLDGLCEDICRELRGNSGQPSLRSIATYYFNRQGKMIRPMVTMLMARAINSHMCKEGSLLATQRRVAMFSEMVHVASLVHDDLIDLSNYRRGKPSINTVWNARQVVMAGNFIYSSACEMIARLKDDKVTLVMCEISRDLVQGELMQLGTHLTINERFTHYLRKTYLKTGSVFANTAKAAALLAGADEETIEIAFQYGRNIGIAFQLVDDMLDFVSTTDDRGKPTAVDLKLGLATAPVLFACEKYPQLNLMILRRFEGEDDVKIAFDLVHKSQAIEETKILAQNYCLEAVRYTRLLEDSPYQQGLQALCDVTLNPVKNINK